MATKRKASDSTAVQEFAKIMNREGKGNKLLINQSARRDITGD
jgi:hypothetical protein